MRFGSIENFFSRGMKWESWNRVWFRGSGASYYIGFSRVGESRKCGRPSRFRLELVAGGW